MNCKISADAILSKTWEIRGKKIMFDRDLAKLYDVSTGQLTRQVKRNINRFPSDFMFQLTKNEFRNLICQFGTSSWGGTRKLPYVFTEQGIAMLSGVLHSKRAIHVNIQIMRAFIYLKRMLLTNARLKRKIDEMEKKYDQQFKVVFDAIRQLLTPPEAPKRRIGFHTDDV